MSRKADIIVLCDICDCAEYRQSELTEDGRRWRGGDMFDWVHVNGKDVCLKCRHAVATAFRLGIAEELQWEDDKASHGLKCPVCGHWVDDADYWAGTMCLRCALQKLAQKQAEKRRCPECGEVVPDDEHYWPDDMCDKCLRLGWAGKVERLKKQEEANDV